MEAKKYYELTKPQQTIWISEKFTQEPINNIIGSMYFKDDINIDLLIKATNLIVKNNDALRTILVDNNGTIMQFFDDFKPFEIEVLDFTCKTDKEIQEFCKSFYESKFILQNHRLFDFVMLKLPNREICLIGKFHHIVADAWSLGLIIDNIAINYSNLAYNSNIPLNTGSYLDFINREQKYLNSDTYSKNKEFWINKLNGYNPISLNSRPNSSFIANRKLFNLSKKTTNSINDFCHNNNISPYTLFMTSLDIYLYRATMQNDITITTPILNRVGKEKHIMGMFINMINMRINNNPNISIIDLLKEISAETVSLFKNSKCPYMDILSDLRKQNSSLNNKSYNIVFSFQNMRPNKNAEGLVDYRVDWNFNGYSQDELVINVTDINDSGFYSISYDYLIDLFSENEIEYLHRRLLTIISNIIKNPSSKIGFIDIIDNEEKNRLLNDYNQTSFDYDKSLTIVDLFENTAKENPDSIAVKFKNNVITYKELNNLSNIIAKEIKNKNIKKSKIAIICDKSDFLIAGLIGILKSGNAYIPVDPYYPQKRIEYILNDSSSQIIVTTKKYHNKYNAKYTIILDDIDYSIKTENINNSSCDDLAYIIYTSGTTGNPKGVTIKHKNIVNTLIWRKNLYNFDNNDRVLQIPSFSFDSSVEDIFTPLISGAELVIPAISKMDVNIIGDELESNNITHFLVVPSLYKVLLKEKLNSLKSLRVITIAGEGFSISLIKEHFSKLPNVRVINEYGPTENSVCSTYYELTANDEKILIGSPINNCKCYCLDNNQMLLPIECEGELYVSGPGVSDGYLNKPDITNERFLRNPFGGKYKLYKTGDMVKFDFSGNLEFIERTDNQVKLHGFRIELKEIENSILENSSVDDTIVIIQTLSNGKQLLVAYIVNKNGEINVQDIYTNLREKLPYYMIPKIVVLDKFPLTPNGKLDRKKLPIPEIEATEFTTPKNDLEKNILSVCQEVLENNKIGVLDDLFTIANADSLSILTISSKLFNMNIKIGIQDFYKYPTVRELANQIINKNNSLKCVDKNIVKPYITLPPNSDLININFEYKNILLAGATGFLGIHILNNLLRNTNCNIYCLIREKYKQTPETRLKNLISYYFNDNYYEIYKNKIYIINSDLTKNNFGLDDNTYLNLKNNIDCVINCAANTKHYGNYNNFKKENIDTVKNLIKFIEGTQITFNHMSTTNVCGNFLVDNDIQYDFTENDLYIGQNYEDNVYIRSKFEAERMIIEAEHNGLNANIFRLGNLMGRYSDGIFQKNKFDNAYYTRLLALAKIGYLPENLRNQNLEFSPIDDVSDAIIKLLCIPNLKNKIFHIFSNKLINISVLLNVYNIFNINCKFTSYDDFMNELNKPQNEKMLKYIINDINSKRGINYDSGITVNNNITNQYLKSVGFKWSTIDEDYLIRFFKSTNFISDLEM